MTDLSGKRAVVTGGAGGIGICCAIGLAQSGADVVITDLSDEACKRTADELALMGHHVTWQGFDVADRTAVEQGFEAIGEVDTPMIKHLHGPKDRELWYAQTPMGRYAEPHEVVLSGLR